MQKNHERRQFQRISFDAPVEISQGKLHVLTEVIDISLKGILVKAPDVDFNPDLPVQIHITLGEDASIIMTAEWAHNKPKSQAYHWTQVDIESVIHLRRLLELNTGDEFLIERELARLGNND